MKRIAFLFVAVLAMTSLKAQNISDALRYGLDETTGTARFHAMSGAFGALGGDLSAIGFNPASSAVFLTNEMSVSMGVFDRENTSIYFGSGSQAIDTDVALNQVGLVFVFDDVTENSKWKKFTIGINYNSTGNTDDDIFIQGIGNTSIANYFVERAQGIPLDLLQLQPGETISQLYQFLGESQGTAAQDALLGFQGFIIDPLFPDDPSNTEYFRNVAGNRFNQQFLESSRGFNGKYTINFGAQYTEDLFIGVNLNAHSIDYIQSNFLIESNNNPNSQVTDIGFQNNLSVLGSGFSAQIGAIAKVTDELRVGLTYDTPTWSEISEETTQYLETDRLENGNVIRTIVDPNVLNVFADYRLRTPGRYAASLAYVFGTSGLISMDYSYRDFSQIEYSSDFAGEFAPLNSIINNTLTGASSIRVGGEYRINQLSLRGGFRYEESPYENGTTVGDLQGFSLGFGYNFGNYNFDISYARVERDQDRQLYGVGLTSVSQVETVQNNIIFTLGLKL